MAAMMRTLVGGLALAASAYSSSALAIEVCDGKDDSGCWRQLTYQNFKDFSVGGGLMCTVGGNSPPAEGSDAYNNPNSYSQNQGTEDIIECRKPDGYSGYSSEPFYPGYGNNPNTWTRFPGGVYDHGSWGGTPTGVIAMFGGYGDDVAVLNSKQHVYIAVGDRNNFKSGGNYQTWTLDRKNIRADTGATLCLKGIYSQFPVLGGFYAHLRALGCNGEEYIAYDGSYRGWLPGYNFKDAGSAFGVLYGLTAENRVRRIGYRSDVLLPVLPSGTPKAVGYEFAVSTTSNRIYQYNDSTAAWDWLNIDYPESQDATSNLRRIQSAVHFRGNAGEFFVWQSAHRVYLYVP